VLTFAQKGNSFEELNCAEALKIAIQPSDPKAKGPGNRQKKVDPSGRLPMEAKVYQGHE